MDKRTEELLNKPRCGNNDINIIHPGQGHVREGQSEGHRRTKRYVQGPSRWKTTNLTYSWVCLMIKLRFRVDYLFGSLKTVLSSSSLAQWVSWKIKLRSHVDRLCGCLYVFSSSSLAQSVERLTLDLKVKGSITGIWAASFILGKDNSASIFPHSI